MSKMHYVTFGQDHAHDFSGIVFDKDCVACLQIGEDTDGREKAFQLFGNKFSFDYSQDEFKQRYKEDDYKKYFPRGLICIATV